MKRILCLFLLLTGLFFVPLKGTAQCNPQKCNCPDDKCPETCLTCKGHGCVDCEGCNAKGWTKCGTCNGIGSITLGGVTNTCVSCQGRGWSGCQVCGGGGATAGTGRHLCYFCMGMGCICPK